MACDKGAIVNNEQVVTDFRRRYEGTYIYLENHTEQTEVLAYVRLVEFNFGRVGIIHLETEEYGKLQLNMGSEGHSLKFKYPPVGVFQHESLAHVFFRRPSRQYRRGLCGDNSTILSTARLFGAPSAGVSRSAVVSAFKHTTYRVYEALPMLSKKFRSVALADNLSVTAPVYADKTTGLVLHYLQAVASFNTRSGKLTKIYEPQYEALLAKHFN